MSIPIIDTLTPANDNFPVVRTTNVQNNEGRTIDQLIEAVNNRFESKAEKQAFIELVAQVAGLPTMSTVEDKISNAISNITGDVPDTANTLKKLADLKADASTVAAISELVTALQAGKADTSTVTAISELVTALQNGKADVNTVSTISELVTALQAGKADASTVAALSESIIALQSGKADDNTVTSISSLVTALQTGKANTSTVTAISDIVATLQTGKADTSTVTAISDIVATLQTGKADTSTVTAISTMVTALQSSKADCDAVTAALREKQDVGTYANGIVYKGTKAALAEIQALSPTLADGEPAPQYFCTADSHYYAWNGTAWDDTGTMNSAASEVEAARGTALSLKDRLDAADEMSTSELQKINGQIILDEKELKDITTDVVKTGSYLSKQGQLVAEGGYYTDLLPCSTGDTFYISGKAQYETCCIATYDSTGEFIRNYYGGTTSGVIVTSALFTPASDEKFVRFGSIYAGLHVKRVLPININQYVSSVNSKINNTIAKTDNITDSLNPTNGYLLTDGSTVLSQGGKLTDFIECAGDTYYITAQAQFSTCCIATYDANHTFLRKYGFASNDSVTELKNYKWVANGDEKYVKFCSYPSGSKFEVIKETSNEEIKETVDDRTIYLGEEFFDITSELQVLSNAYLSKVDGTISRGEGGKSVINLIPCTSGDVYKVTAQAQYGTACIVTYGSDGTKEHVYGYSNDDSAYSMSEYEFTPSSGEVYVRFGTYPSSANLKVVKKISRKTIKQKISEFPSPEQSVGVLYKKKWVACGDSYTEGDFAGFVDDNGRSGKNSPVIYDSKRKMYKTYPWWIAERNQMELINEAKCGSYFTNCAASVMPFSTDRYLAVPTDADYITLMFGLNEVSVSIGNNTDTTNNTLWGAYNIVLTHFLTNMPYAKIGIIIADAWMTETYANAVKSIAEYWGIPYLDLKGQNVPMGLSGRYSETSPTARSLRNNSFIVSNDNYHPNVQAHKYRSTFIENFLRSL